MSDSPRRRGLSMIEIMIVVVIIGILAAIAVPKFANASQSARETATKRNLQQLRSLMGVYCTQHQDVWPGYPGGDITQTPTYATVSDQLLNHSDASGNTSPVATSVYTFGPYMNEMPLNPINNLTTWKILGPADPIATDDSTGWLFQPASGTIKPNVSGIDSTGRVYLDY